MATIKVDSQTSTHNMNQHASLYLTNNGFFSEGSLSLVILSFYCFSPPLSMSCCLVNLKIAEFVARSFFICPSTINVLVSAHREVSADVWIIARLFETGKFRALLHPEYFSKAPHDTLQWAMQARRAVVDQILSSRARLLQGDMAEVNVFSISKTCMFLIFLNLPCPPFSSHIASP